MGASWNAGRAILAAALVLLAWTATAQPTRDPALHFFQAGFGDLQEELALARAEGKQGLFVMFSAEACTPCIVMKKTVLNQVAVQERFRRHFRVLEIDYNGDAEMADLDGRRMRSKDYAQHVARVRGTPSFTVIGLDGKELLRHYGPTNGRQFMWFADYVVDGAYRREPFEAYWRDRLAGKQPEVVSSARVP
jgi:thioredoxin-related protein